MIAVSLPFCHLNNWYIVSIKIANETTPFILIIRFSYLTIESLVLLSLAVLLSIVAE